MSKAKPLVPFVLTLIFSLFVNALYAATEAQPRIPETSPLASFLYAVLPIVIIAVVLWLFLRKTQRSPFMQRSIEHYERSEKHMERMEQIGERIATALERRNKDNGQT